MGMKKEHLEEVEDLQNEVDTCSNSETLTFNDAKRGHLVHTFDTWGPNYLISFDIRMNKKLTNVEKWHNIFHFTATGNNCCSAGDRIPAVWIRDGAFLWPDFNGSTLDKSEEHKFIPMVINQWYHVRFSQEQIGSSAVRFTGEVDGANVTWTWPMPSTQYKNVKWYQSDPWHASIGELGDAFSIKNMIVMNNYDSRPVMAY